MKTSCGRGTCWSPGAAGIGCYLSRRTTREFAGSQREESKALRGLTNLTQIKISQILRRVVKTILPKSLRLANLPAIRSLKVARTTDSLLGQRRAGFSIRLIA